MSLHDTSTPEGRAWISYKIAKPMIDGLRRWASAGRMSLWRAAAALGLDAWMNTVKPTNEGEDERARQRKYREGLGSGQRRLMEQAGMTSGGFHNISGDFASDFKGEESTYRGT